MHGHCVFHREFFFLVYNCHSLVLQVQYKTQVHCIYNEMMKVLWTVLSQFIKPKIMERCNTGGELLKMDIKNQENQLLLNKIDFGGSAN